MSRALRLAQEVQGLFEQAEKAGRALTADEREWADRTLDEAQDAGRMERSSAELGREIGAPFGNNTANGNGHAFESYEDAGSKFVNSDGYKAIADRGQRPQSWSTGLIDVGSALQMKGTLLEGVGSPGSGTGGGLVPVPQVAPGVVQTLFNPCHSSSC